MSLTSVVGNDYDFLFRLATDEQTGFRWRYNGQLPSLDAFATTVWQDVLSQLIVRVEGEPSGVVAAYGANLHSGYCYFGVAMMPSARDGAGILASLAFLNYLFVTWPFHKIYIELPSFNLSQFARTLERIGGRLEAEYREHHWYAGERWSKLVYALYREESHERVRALASRWHDASSIQ